MKCERCGNSVERGGSRRKYCAGCAAIVKSERGRARYAADAERAREATRQWRRNHPGYNLKWRTAKLARERPDIHLRVLAGEVSLLTGMREAGLLKPRVRPQAAPTSTATK
jgi:hypothetical protein